MMESGSPRLSRSPGMLHDLPATSSERRAWAKATRERARRGTLGYWAEGDRRHDALETILTQNQIRVPELVPVRYQRMAASPWITTKAPRARVQCDSARTLEVLDLDACRHPRGIVIPRQRGRETETVATDPSVSHRASGYPTGRAGLAEGTPPR